MSDSKKKEKRPKAAQQLIDSLLDENSSAADLSFDEAFQGTFSKVSGESISFNITAPHLNLSADESNDEASGEKSDENGSPADFEVESVPVPQRKAPPVPSVHESVLMEVDETGDFNLSIEEKTGSKITALKPLEVATEELDSSAKVKSSEPAAKNRSEMAKTQARHHEKVQEKQQEKQQQKQEKVERTVAIDSEQTESGVDARSKLSIVRPNPAHSTAAPSEETAVSPVEKSSVIDRQIPTEIRSNIRSQAAASAPPSQGGGVRSSTAVAPSSAFSSAEAALKQSENLRIAQSRISELEQELERVRRENEKLAAAGETLRRRADEFLSRSENHEAQARELERMYEEEKKVLRMQLQAKDRETIELHNKLEETESRLEANFKKIRVRERELEHRLEIVKMESATLVSTKDKMILDLKRQLDQVSSEQEYAQSKTQELYNQYKGKQETIRRVVRALRIALTILEGDDESSNKD